MTRVVAGVPDIAMRGRCLAALLTAAAELSQAFSSGRSRSQRRVLLSLRTRPHRGGAATGMGCGLADHPGVKDETSAKSVPPRSRRAQTLLGGVDPLGDGLSLAHGGAARRWVLSGCRSVSKTVPKPLRRSCPPRRPRTRPCAATIAADGEPFFPGWSRVPVHQVVRSIRNPPCARSRTVGSP